MNSSDDHALKSATHWTFEVLLHQLSASFNWGLVSDKNNNFIPLYSLTVCLKGVTIHAPKRSQERKSQERKWHPVSAQSAACHEVRSWLRERLSRASHACIYRHLSNVNKGHICRYQDWWPCASQKMQRLDHRGWACGTRTRACSRGSCGFTRKTPLFSSGHSKHSWSSSQVHTLWAKHEIGREFRQLTGLHEATSKALLDSRLII